MTDIIISGALGRMGKKVKEICDADGGVRAVCGVDIKDDFSVLGFPVYGNFDKITEKADAIIDFSSPAALDGILDFAVKTGTPAVLCSTGYSAAEIDKIISASDKVAIFRSANMSLGANIVIELAKKAAALLEDFDIEIIEKHHNQKADAPSGTALMIADAIKEVQSDKFFIYGREGKVGKRNPKEIGIHAVRGGNIVGEHDAIFAGNNETVTISHQATDRGVFAIGAVKAAKFLSDKKNGLYNMQDLIKGL